MAKAIGNSNTKRKECCFMEKKDQVGRGCFEPKSTGEKQEFREIVSLWLSCGIFEFL